MLVERFLSLVCEIAGACSAHLRIVHLEGGGEVPLLDSRSGLGDSGVGGDMSSGERYAAGVAGDFGEIVPGGRLRPGEDTGVSIIARSRQMSIFGEMEPAPAAFTGGRSDTVLRECPPDGGDPASGWSVREHSDSGIWCFDRRTGTVHSSLRLAFGRAGGGLVRVRLRAVENALAFLELILGDTAAPAGLDGGVGLPGACGLDGSAWPGCGGVPDFAGGTGERDAERPVRFDPPLIGASTAVCLLRRRIEILSSAASTVLVEGESGTGKEVVARNLHRLGGRSGGRLVIASCMEMPMQLLQSELFGSARGSFTGASRDRAGLIESAAGGTFFLDEIGEMPPALQAGLLRVLQEKEVRRIGESRRRRIDVRFVLATNRDLAALVSGGRFRKDLYYRISGIRILLPPLRERRSDIAVLAGYFLQQEAARSGSRTPRLSVEAMRLLLAHPWPGNVRELRNEMERALVLHPDILVIRPAMLSPHIRETAGRGGGRSPAGDGTLPAAVERLERGMIARALALFQGNRTRSAAALGITRQGLLKKLKRFGMAGATDRP